MSLDGCLEVAWKGQAFPFLLHHPSNGFLKTENYGSARSSAATAGHQPTPAGRQQASSDTLLPAGTGTWNGPAPRGFIRDGVNTAAAQPSAAATATATAPQDVRISSGQLLPLLGLSTAGVTSADVISQAVGLGCRHVTVSADTSDVALVGKGLQGALAAGKRDTLFISAALRQTDQAPARVRPAFDQLLAGLGCGHVDLLVMAGPEALTADSAAGGAAVDTTVTIIDTWRALESIVDAGLAKALGVSNFSLKQVEELLAAARVKPAVNLVELTPLLPQRKLVGVCFRKGVQCVAHTPLGGPRLQSHPAVAAVAAEAGKSAAQVLLRWSALRGVPAVTAAADAALVKEYFETAAGWSLTSQQREVLNSLEDGTRFYAPNWKQWADPAEGGAAKPSLALA